MSKSQWMKITKISYFICTAQSPWVSHKGSWGWAGEVLHDSVLSQGSRLGMEEPWPQWARGAHGKLCIGSYNRSSLESVLFFLCSHSIGQSKSHGISDLKEVKFTHTSMCMEGESQPIEEQPDSYSFLYRWMDGWVDVWWQMIKR